MAPSVLGDRTMALKLTLPLLNIPELIRRHPRVLRSEVHLQAPKQPELDPCACACSPIAMCCHQCAILLSDQDV